MRVDHQRHNEDHGEGVGWAEQVLEPEKTSEEILPNVKDVVTVVWKHERMGLREKVGQKNEEDRERAEQKWDIGVKSDSVDQNPQVVKALRKRDVHVRQWKKQEIKKLTRTECHLVVLLVSQDNPLIAVIKDQKQDTCQNLNHVSFEQNDFKLPANPHECPKLVIQT